MTQARWGNDAKTCTTSRHSTPGRSRSQRMTGALSWSKAARASSHVSAKSTFHCLRLHTLASRWRSSSVNASPMTVILRIGARSSRCDDREENPGLPLRTSSETVLKSDCIPRDIVSIERRYLTGDRVQSLLDKRTPEPRRQFSCLGLMFCSPLSPASSTTPAYRSPPPLGIPYGR